jgi:GNAT superfamily N-acetyltransferase
LDTDITIRPFASGDAPRVRELFIAINRELAPAHLRDAFEAYIARALAEEVDRIEAYYRKQYGGFWVALIDDRIVGTVGLERSAGGAMELRRMYVDTAERRRGIARRMLRFAEDECRRRGTSRLELSTAELQSAALALYRNSGYRLVREDVAGETSNKTVGGIRRYHFEKSL